MNGFFRNASGVFFSRIVVVVWPDIIMTFISGRCSRTLSASSKPFIRGICTSVRSKCIGSANFSLISSAYCPSLAVRRA